MAMELWLFHIACLLSESGLFLLVSAEVSASMSTLSSGAGLDRSSEAVQELEPDSENERLLSSIPRPYEIIYPMQLNGNTYKPVSTWLMSGRKTLHVNETVFLLHVFGHKRKVHVELASHLISPFVRRKYDLEGGSSAISERVDHCYYQGYVEGYVGSTVALSTCAGLNGVLELGNETFVIKPLRSAKKGLNRPHVLYPAVSHSKNHCGVDEARWMSFVDLHREEYLRRLKLASAEDQKKGGNYVSPWKVIEMAVVIDHDTFARRNTSDELTIIDDILLVINIADMYFKSLRVNLTIVYVESWNLLNKVKMDQNLTEILQDFIKYKQQASDYLKNDNAQLFSSWTDLDESAGLAVPEGICTDHSVGISRIGSPYQPTNQANLLAHIISHNLGLKHDAGYCSCSEGRNCLMYSNTSSPGDLHTREFSDCSIQALEHLVSVGLLDCLLKDENRVSYPSVCGNGIVERGEQCDCIGLEHCMRKDPCCDPQTCLLHSWAQCNNGPCCANCMFERNRMCRPASNECDVPEFCPGDSARCPINERVQDGTTCAIGRGLCYKGHCSTHGNQCAEIWGDGAKMSDRACYNRFNVLGSTNGHCGANASSHLYNKCDERNVFCGLLHCIGGDPVPTIGAKETYTKMIVSEGGYEFQCNILNTISIPSFPQDGVVRDGTKCGERAICLKHQCVDLMGLVVGQCPSKDPKLVCSGHGICTNRLRCYCAPFWTGPDCADMMPIPTREVSPFKYQPIITYNSDRNLTDNLPPLNSVLPDTHVVEKASENSVSTQTLMIILGAVASVVMLFLVFLMFCYRRKSPGGYHSPYAPSWMRKKFQPNPPRSVSSDEGVTGTRIIKFGNMPSYREEKYRELRDRVLRIKQGLLEPACSENSMSSEEKRASHVSDSSQVQNLMRQPKRGILKNQDKKDEEDCENADSAERLARIRSLDDLIEKIERQVVNPDSDYKRHSRISAELRFEAERANRSSEEPREGRIPEFPGPLLKGKLSIYVPPPPLGPSEVNQLDVTRTADTLSSVDSDVKFNSQSMQERAVKKPRKHRKGVTSSGSETSVKSTSTQGSQKKGKRKQKTCANDSDSCSGDLPALPETTQPPAGQKTGIAQERSETGDIRKMRSDFKPNILPLASAAHSKSPLYQKKFSPSGMSAVYKAASAGSQQAPLAVNLVQEETDFNDLSPESNVLDSFSSDTSPNDPPSNLLNARKK